MLIQGLLSLLLVSCSSLPPAPLPSEGSRQAVTGLETWSLRGRVNIRRGNASDTVNINWQQDRAEYDINLSGTLGLGAVRISGGPGGVFIEKSAEETLIFSSLEEVTSDLLGYAFPAGELLYWIRGIPAPGSPAQTTPNTEGLTATLSQIDTTGRRWELQYDRYRNIDGFILPGRLRLEQSPYRLTFVISDWEISGSGEQ